MKLLSASKYRYLYHQLTRTLIIVLGIGFLITSLHSVLSTIKPSFAQSPFLLVTEPWVFNATSEATEKYISIDQPLPNNATHLSITFNLNGACLLESDASALVFNQPAGVWQYASLFDYADNCSTASQTATIPLSSFGSLNPNEKVENFHIRFWLDQPYHITVTDVRLLKQDPSESSKDPDKSSESISSPPQPSIHPLLTPTSAYEPNTGIEPNLNLSPNWQIKSVSSMKETKDRICNPRDEAFIQQWVATAKDLGVTHISISTPYDDPACGSSLRYTTSWINAIRAADLKVWHRHMPMAFEGIYSVPKTKQDYLPLITSYLRQHSDLFQPGDIVTPIPEPQNGGIQGVTFCSAGVCQFEDSVDFNRWLRQAYQQVDATLQDLDKSSIRVGYYGFDGFVVWGDNNPHWGGILEPETVALMGNITLDHYPELINSNWIEDLQEFRSKYPTTPVVIGEWGTVGENKNQAMQMSNALDILAQDPYIVGFNYWHMGVGGREALIKEDFSLMEGYYLLQSYFAQL